MTEKVFSPGEVLTAADVNDYLVNRTGSGNAIINGAFDIWQRGTSFAHSTGVETRVADRFVYNSDGTGTTTISQETFTPGEPATGVEGTFYLRYTSSGRTGQTFNVLYNQIEDVRTLSAQTITLSFYARTNAAKSITIDHQQTFGSGGSSSVSTTFGTANIGTSWERFTFTISAPSVSGKTINTGNHVRTIFRLGNGSAGTIDIWGIQLEAGSVATPFKRNANSLQGELAACQRYFFRGGPGAQGIATLTTLANLIISYPVPMRAAPSVSHVANYNVLEVNVATRTATALESFSGGTLACNLGVTVGAGGMTVSNMVRISGATGPNLDFSAEL
jgi:hypothetical protein